MSNLSEKSVRLKSLDALRGFDMFWIIGGSSFFILLCNKISPKLNFIAEQMYHAHWEGVRFFDTIFPLFIFIAGISMAFSMNKHLHSNVCYKIFNKFDCPAKLHFFYHLFKRACILIVLGMIYNGALTFEFSTLRYFSVLGLIGSALLIGGTIALFSQTIRGLVLSGGCILLFVSGLQWFLQLDGYGGSFEMGKIINVYFDQPFKGHLNGGSWDPEGVINVLSSSFLAIMGCAIGRFLLSSQKSDVYKVLTLFLCGFFVFVTSSFLGEYYPIIKKAWTPTFNLLMCGYGLVIFSLFYLIIDVLKIEKWSRPFQVIGANSIAIYFAVAFIPFSIISKNVFGGVAGVLPAYHDLILSAGVLIVEIFLLWFLHRHKIFIKV